MVVATAIRFNRQIICLMLIFLSSFNATATTKLRIVTENWPPHIYLDNQGHITGAMTERVKKIVEQAGFKYSLAMYPWPRTYNIALTQKNVLIYPLFKHPARLERFHFICPFTQKVDLYLYRLAIRDNIQINALPQAKQYIIGLVRNDYDHLMLKQYGFEDGKNIDANANDDSSLKKLLKRRIDLMVHSKESMMRLIKKFNLSKGVVTEAFKLPNHVSGENCIALSLGTDAGIVSRVRQALEAINSSGPLLKLE